MSEITPERGWEVFTELQEQTERVRVWLFKNFATNGMTLDLSDTESTELWDARVALERIGDRLESGSKGK